MTLDSALTPRLGPLNRGSKIMINSSKLLNVGDRFYVQIPNQTGERILHPAVIVEKDETKYIGEVEVSSPPLEAGNDIIIFFELNGEFMQQAGRIDMVKPSTATSGESSAASILINNLPGTTVGFQLAGEPASAENRQCYRVSTVMVDLTATLEDEVNCQLLDISSCGFSLLSSREHAYGSLVEVTLSYGQNKYSGKARIQNIIENPRGVYRYGLRGEEDSAIDRDLATGRQIISMEIQRIQLRRRTGSD